jgi:hypothetical protein
MREYSLYSTPTEPNDEELKEMIEVLGAQFVTEILKKCWIENAVPYCENEEDRLSVEADFSPEQTRVICWMKLDKESYGCTHAVLLTYNYGEERPFLASYGINPDSEKIKLWAC